MPSVRRSSDPGEAVVLPTKAALMLNGEGVGVTVGTITSIVEVFTFGPFDEEVMFDAVEFLGRDGDPYVPDGGEPFVLPSGTPFALHVTTACELDSATAHGAVGATGTVSGHGRIVDVGEDG